MTENKRQIQLEERVLTSRHFFRGEMSLNRVRVYRRERGGCGTVWAGAAVVA